MGVGLGLGLGLGLGFGVRVRVGVRGRGRGSPPRGKHRKLERAVKVRGKHFGAGGGAVGRLVTWYGRKVSEWIYLYPSTRCRKAVAPQQEPPDAPKIEGGCFSVRQAAARLEDGLEHLLRVRGEEEHHGALVTAAQLIEERRAAAVSHHEDGHLVKVRIEVRLGLRLRLRLRLRAAVQLGLGLGLRLRLKAKPRRSTPW